MRLFAPGSANGGTTISPFASALADLPTPAFGFGGTLLAHKYGGFRRGDGIGFWFRFRVPE